ncbi:PepSY domain-containing protein [Antarcticibacterium sp. 1MA-6-2]|uniref:PepSY-associated TM helix domain-containing protein n=1 Tax=Antarcticibacterium sp. 1MA-6-2 TaxID=2908210 RepID=UPI002101EBF7|nr:PepSY domain-containing protein [Antarcticibacterium sp. 1MA-6-2]
MSKSKSGYTIKKFVRQAHLYLGLASGLVIFIVAITGCLWAFQEEITALTYDLPEVQSQDTAVILPTEAKSIAKSIYPDKHVHGTLYEEETDPVKVIFYEPEPEFYRTVYLQPYTGEVMKVENNLTAFFL